MRYDEFTALTDEQRDELFIGFMIVAFNERANDAIKHMGTCDSCRAKYANMFADFMINDVMSKDVN